MEKNISSLMLKVILTDCFPKDCTCIMLLHARYVPDLAVSLLEKTHKTAGIPQAVHSV